ncbi:MAG: hydantoinase/oxoprolinase family protein [Chloroflexota bacterium]
MRIGIDVGGTFTDLVLIDDRGGQVHYTKTSTTPGNLADGVLTGIEKILGIAGARIDDVEYIVHGTTIGTNALIEKTGARAGLITTEGFIDVLDMGRCQRPREGMYDLSVDSPPPLVPRDLRRAVRERIDRDGSVVVPLDERTAVDAVDLLKGQRVEAIAISLLWSLANPAHERRVAEIVAERFPGAPVSISSDIAPEFREYERTSTTVLNAYLQPVTTAYVDSLSARLKQTYQRDLDVRIMQASGGSMTLDEARHRAVNMVNSGPAGGVIAATFIGALTGLDQLVGVDMGGTSFDISIVDRGRPSVSAERSFAGYPVRIPVIDIDTIGAGGGSIAWVDGGGALNVGPRSAGAQPGPACYGRGGERPAVTDANLVLGRLNPDYFLGGEMTLDVEAARAAIDRQVGSTLGLSTEDAAAGIIRIINATMAKGISVNSIERGHDVREFALVAFGGAGALHAVDLADDMGIGTVVVPTLAGNLSALGLLVSDARHDFARTYGRLVAETDGADPRRRFEELQAQAVDRLRQDGFKEERMDLLWTADLRYEGQSYELNIPANHDPDRLDLPRLVDDFHREHQRLYAYSSPRENVQLVNLRVTGIGRVPPVELKPASAGAGGLQARSAEPRARRRMFFFTHGFIEAPIYERDDLPVGGVIEGPCLVEETIASSVIAPGWAGRVDQYRNLILRRRANG